MIVDDQQLDAVRQQIARLESALESLTKTVRAKGEKQFQVLAEGYIDQIEVLRRDVEAYEHKLKLAPASKPLPTRR